MLLPENFGAIYIHMMRLVQYTGRKGKKKVIHAGIWLGNLKETDSLKHLIDTVILNRTVKKRRKLCRVWAEDREKWTAAVNTVMNIPQYTGNFVISRGKIKIRRRICSMELVKT